MALSTCDLRSVTAAGYPRLLAVLTAAALTASFCGCSLFRGKPEAAAGNDPVSQAVATDRDMAKAQEALRGAVQGYILSENRAAAERKDKVIYRRPYYFREYAQYANDPAPVFEFEQTESRTAPYAAHVEIDKVRYATRLRRRMKDAEQDMNFLRDTGRETITYEWRNGRWMRTGSLFVATRTEENVNGEWVPVQETVKEALAEEGEEERGWFSRMWRGVTGRY